MILRAKIVLTARGQTKEKAIIVVFFKRISDFLFKFFHKTQFVGKMSTKFLNIFENESMDDLEQTTDRSLFSDHEQEDDAPESSTKRNRSSGKRGRPKIKRDAMDVDLTDDKKEEDSSSILENRQG